jgi:hypothetical protein
MKLWSSTEGEKTGIYYVRTNVCVNTTKGKYVDCIIFNVACTFLSECQLYLNIGLSSVHTLSILTEGHTYLNVDLSSVHTLSILTECGMYLNIGLSSVHTLSILTECHMYLNIGLSRVHTLSILTECHVYLNISLADFPVPAITLRMLHITEYKLSQCTNAVSAFHTFVGT